MSEHARVLIIGGGPAGLTAALYAARAELKPLVVEGLVPGGQLMITTEVENFPGFPEGITGPDIVEKVRLQAEKFGTAFRYGMVTSVDASERPFRCVMDEDEDDVITADTIIVAAGADARWLGLEDEKRLTNYGVSACATCDGAFFKGVEIGVVGGGDTALEEAMFLTRFGTKVHVVHRRDELRASKIMAARALAHEKLEFHWDSVVTAIGGDHDEGVTSVTLKNVKTDAETEHPWKALFIAIGHKPNTGIWQGILDLDEAGYIITKPDSTYTNVDGIFACGDVQDSHYRQAITAAGTGCMSAIDAERWLEAKAAE
jgi:thioredoxin reductase (NADPH)